MNINETFRYQNVGLPEDILRRKLHGDFDGAIRLIDRRLAEEALSQSLRNCLTVHREMIRRLPEEFPYTPEEALAIIRNRIPDFTQEEFDALIDDRLIRWIYVKGEMRIFNRFYSSLCKAYKGFAHRAHDVMPGAESAVGGVPLLDHAIQVMTTQGSMTNRIRIRATMKVKDEHFTPGMFIRAHLPIPSACDQQSDIRIEKIFPETDLIAPEDAPQRTICWEENMAENHEFMVEYSYLHTARFCPINVPGIDDKPDFDIGEIAPHVVFTPFIRHLAQELTQGITDPLEKARAFYDYITLNMDYTFMPSYFLLDNIVETCAQNNTGDCGVFALLFMTLCRCAGIPAQWQSGFLAEPDFIGGHDWIRFYVAPYGWLYADLSFGISAKRNDNEPRRKFYFGNIEPYRMVANSAFQTEFTVPKKHWRGDPYDNQVGEMETDTHDLTYDQFIRTKEILLCEQV